jgi:DNA polymerase-3 subunit gamma/tau
MAYTVIARKYRPMLFEDVVGQEHVTRTLMNALSQNRVAHAYIFSGPRGVGKTTTARLLAKAVNCEKQPAVNPCNECHSCKSITAGNSMDVIEIDGASNRGIDEVRNIRDAIRYAPAESRYKIYIIDEVHMLTRDAFNALLKTLEEPPSHAMFIFATTEIHKVPLTILSRCQRYDFKRIPIKIVQTRLREICTQEKVDITDEALFLIARKGDGSMRDAQSLLDQVISYTEGQITDQEVRQLLGLIDEDIFFSFSKIIYEKNTHDLIHLSHEVITSGHDLNDFLLQLEEHFRNLLVARTTGNADLIDAADVHKEKYLNQKDLFTEDQLIKAMNMIAEYEPRIRVSSHPELLFELLLLKMLKIPDLISLDKVLAFITALKKAGGKFEIDSELLNRVPGELPSTPTRKKAKSIQAPEKLPSHPATSTWSIDEIRERWEDFLQFIENSKKKKMTKSYLALYYPYQLTNQVLSLAIDKKSASSFIKNHLISNKNEILKWMEEFFGKRLDYKLMELDFKAEGIEWVVMTREQVFELMKEKNPNIKLIDDIFDLDVYDEGK